MVTRLADNSILLSKTPCASASSAWVENTTIDVIRAYKKVSLIAVLVNAIIRSFFIFLKNLWFVNGFLNCKSARNELVPDYGRQYPHIAGFCCHVFGISICIFIWFNIIGYCFGYMVTKHHRKPRIPDWCPGIEADLIKYIGGNAYPLSGNSG